MASSPRAGCVTVSPIEEGRLATVEAVLNELRQDIAQVRQEQERTRGRLHDLEKSAQGLLLMQRERIQRDERLFQTLGLRLKYLSLAIALAAVLLTAAGLVLHHG